MAGNRHPKDNMPFPKRPWDSEGANQPTYVLEEQRKQSGGLPDSSPEMPVKDKKSFTIKKEK